jgi:hypothetical protein
MDSAKFINLIAYVANGTTVRVFLSNNKGWLNLVLRLSVCINFKVCL